MKTRKDEDIGIFKVKISLKIKDKKRDAESLS